MPNPKLETYKNKATGDVYDYTDADAQGKLTAILDGTTIDSFADVESALADKVDAVAGKGLSTNDYDNTAKGIVDNIQSNVIANTKLIKDTVGWSGKNKLPNSYTTQTTAGVTFVVDTDGIVTVNGTVTSGENPELYLLNKTTSNEYEGMILSCGVSEITKCYMRIRIGKHSTGAYIRELNGDNIVIPRLGEDEDYYISIRAISGKTINNLKFYPMIRPADILDSTYEPYFGSTAFPRSEQAVLGAKNLAPINATTVTNKGITLTVDENKIITIDGTATEAVGFEISKRGQWLKNGGQYKLSGCKGGAVDKYKLDIAYTDTGFLAINYDEDEVEFTANNIRNYVMRIVVYAGQTMNNVVIKPMVRLATDTDPTFAPPAMTNKELTEKVASRVIFKTLSDGDLDDILTTGWYSWGGTAPAHSPQGVAYSCMQCIVETGVQKQIVYFGADVIYMRQRSGSPATWGSWYKFQGTVVS